MQPKECSSSYSDANVASSDCDNNSRCTSGSIILYSGCPVSSEIKLQSLLSFSTVNDELRALGLVTAEAVWIIELLEELYFSFNCDFLCDNKPTIQSVLNTISGLGTRHVRKYSDFVKQQAKLQKMTLSYVNTNDDSADMFTKQLPQEPFKKTVGTQVFSEKSPKAAIFLIKKGSLLVHRRIHWKKRLEPYKTIWYCHWWTKLEHQNSQL